MMSPPRRVGGHRAVGTLEPLIHHGVRENLQFSSWIRRAPRVHGVHDRKDPAGHVGTAGRRVVVGGVVQRL